MLYEISYDLTTPGKDYNGLYNAIKSFGSWAHALESSWIVQTNLSASDIYNKLSHSLDKNDRIFIVEIKLNNSYWFLNEKVADWLTDSCK
ncbi:MAG: hypothetical protein PHQ11_10105 [Paludibacter sp.]|nr:hypothetical protein [Paludibacter sp.]